MAKKRSATVQLECWKEHVCVGCGSTFRYRMSKEKSAEAATPKEAKLAARKRAMKSLEDSVEMQPCPSCGIYQPDMIGTDKAANHGFVTLALVLLLGIVVVAGVLVTMGIIGLPILYPILTWIAAGLGTVASFLYIGFALRNPNRDLSANRNVAQQALEKKTLKLEAQGRTEQLGAGRSPKFGLACWLAVLLLIVGVGLLASAEMVRLLSGWPLNSECVPLVVGPGDEVDVYLLQSVKAVKGYWNGAPTVAVVSWRELGLTSPQLPASSKADHWGKFLVGKGGAQDSRLWVRVPIPANAALSGKDLPLQIQLIVTYPAKEGLLGFQDKRETFEHATELRLASLHAGHDYLMLWWAGGAVGGLLVLLAGAWLARTATGMEREALPSKVVPIDDDEVADVLPAD